MDPDLQEMFEDGSGNDEVAAIIHLANPGTFPQGVRVISQFGPIVTVRFARQTIPAINAAAEVVAMMAGDTFLGPDLEIDTAEAINPSLEMKETDQRRPDGQSATGRGVVVGVVDWGFDFAHPDLRKRDGTSRIIALWDQRGGKRDGAPQPYGYGIVHTRPAINKALASQDPYAALSYHPADADTGVGCHGTHVVSIAAGTGGDGRPVGIAPEADLILVHNSTWSNEPAEKLGDSVTLLEAIDFIAKTAGDRPWVINLSMGRHGEQHDGTTLVEQGLDAVVSLAAGRAICMSAGNYFNKKIHSSGQIRPTEDRVLMWSINADDPTDNELEFWYSWRDKMDVEIRSPDQSSITRAKLGERTRIIHNAQEDGNVYHRPHGFDRPNNQVDIFLYRDAPTGQWEITLFATDVVDGRFHAWIERDALCPKCQSHFRPEDAISASTTGTICNGFRTVAVGAYNAHDEKRRIGPFSSVGPTFDGRLKPDLCAPGVMVLAARSAPKKPVANQPLLTRMSGTSMAAPHVTGAVALIFEAAPRRLQIVETRNLLLESVERVSVPEDNLDRIGSGYLDIDKAVDSARKLDIAARPLSGKPGLEMKPAVRTPSKASKGASPAGEITESLEAVDATESSENDAASEAVAARSAESIAAPKASPARADQETLARCDSVEGFSEGAFGRILETGLTFAAIGSMLQQSMGGGNRPVPPPSDPIQPADVFDVISSPYTQTFPSRRALADAFDLVALPGGRMNMPVQAGDLLFRRALGEDRIGFMNVVGSPLRMFDDFVGSGVRLEGVTPGWYAIVLDDDNSGRRRDPVARFIAGLDGRVPLDQMILRLHNGANRIFDGNGKFTSGDSESAEAGDTPIPDTELHWADATSEQMDFMRAVYRLHVQRSSAGRPFTADIPDDRLDTIQGAVKAIAAAAVACRQMLASAKSALESDRQAGNDLAARTLSIGIVSGYRPASEQFSNWQKNFPKYYRQTQATRDALSNGPMGPAAVATLASYIGARLAAPGFSLHNTGMAVDLSAHQANGLLTADSSKESIQRWRASWFFNWLSNNAPNSGFHQNSAINEPWHWEFRPGSSPSATPPPREQEIPASSSSSMVATSSNMLEIGSVPLLAGHKGTPPDLVLLWNDMSARPQTVDVVVHLHGYSSRGLKMSIRADKLPASGLQPSLPGRSRPTLAILPRGHFTGAANGKAYDFPALMTETGLRQLIDFSLAQFADTTGMPTPKQGRLILTAHSGGGHALVEILRHTTNDPDEVHIFDALYWSADPLSRWAANRIRRDRAMIENSPDLQPELWMANQGSALRIIYLTGAGTETNSRAVQKAICAEIPPIPNRAAGLSPWYRVEHVIGQRVSHGALPNTFGPTLLADAGHELADVSMLDCSRPASHESDFTNDTEDARPSPLPEYPRASRFVAAKWFSPKSSPRTISRIVIHITDGGRNIAGPISWFQNPVGANGNPVKVSAHYVVGQDGEVVQMVANNDVAWHANSANDDSIGIEHVANTRGLVPTQAEYCASAALTRWLCDQFGIPIDRNHILGHSEADPKTTHTSCPNAVWDWVYYMYMVQNQQCIEQSAVPRSSTSPVR